MKPIAMQRCVHIERKMEKISMFKVETFFEMKLFHDEIVVNDERFPLDHIFDISFYPTHKEADEFRFLYLHTHSGVRTFYVREKPLAFINMYRKLISEKK